MRGLLSCVLAAVAFNGHAAEPIPNVTAKATSAQVERLFGAENLCKDTGLTDSGKKDGSQKLTTNGYFGGGSMWHTGYLPHGGDENPIVEFDLGKQFTVGRFHVWNQNSDPHRGFRNVSVLTSTDGKFWQPVVQQFEFKKAPKSEDYLGEDYFFKPPVKARYIRFHCESTHRGGGGNRELAGLGKVRFYEATADELTAKSPAENNLFPASAGIINVRNAPYFAKGDGVTDDTAAIQQAMTDWQSTRRIVFLPAGTYLISKTLRFKPGNGFGYNNFRGESATKTTLKLKDNTFTDASKPQAVLSLAFNGKEDGSGVHADWFNNNVSDLTLHTGNGNPGAIGLQYYSNNVGALRDVVIQRGDRPGIIGLDLGYADQNGPCLIKNIQVDGFTTGVRSGATVNSQTAEHITIRNCTKVGWNNAGQCLSIRGLKVSGSGAGLINQFGVVAIIDAEFTGIGSSNQLPAISNGETLFARNIKTSGFKKAIENKRKQDKPTPDHEEANVREWVSSPVLTLFPVDKPRSLNLPIKETPDVPWEEPLKWVNIRSFREITDPDDSASLQRAIDSGATTIYLPVGATFFFGKPVKIRGNVQRIVGMFADVRGVKGDAVWRLMDGKSPVVVIQEIHGDLQVEHRSTRTLVVKNGQGLGGHLLEGGEVFIENITANWNFSKGNAWARQYNNEHEGTHVSNAGANLWILGLKTERGGTLIETKAGASTEVIGGLCYTTIKGKLAPMFVSNDARASYVIGEVCYSGDPYTRIVEQRRGKESKILNRPDVPLRPAFLQGSQIPLFVADP